MKGTLYIVRGLIYDHKSTTEHVKLTEVKMSVRFQRLNG